MFRIGVVGYSGKPFCKVRAVRNLCLAFHLVMVTHPEEKDFEVISGLTECPYTIGIPAISYRLADIFGWKTAGVACKLVEEYECYDCDRVQIVGKEWGGMNLRLFYLN